MSSTYALVVVIVVIALAFDYTNGFHDAANAIATSVATKALKPRAALALAALGNLAGAFLSVGVAATVGKGIIKVAHTNHGLFVILASLVGAIAWNLITWWFGLPSSSSHALIGGLVGAALISHEVVQWKGVYNKVIIPMIISPLIGFSAAFVVTLLLQYFFRNAKKSRVGMGFKFMQTISAGAMALGHGLQDAQKTMGVIAITLVIGNYYHGDGIPSWVKVAAALAISLGTYIGGWRIMKTLGHKMVEVDPIRGVSSSGVASIVLFYMAIHLKAPVSTTHTITSSILGSGATRGRKAVRWTTVSNILGAWIFTLPAAALCAAVVYSVLKLFGAY
jgi:inorganic phosphate transporter, PiT family